MTLAYSVDALTYNPDANTWTLRADYNHVDHRVDIAFDDDDNMLDGDTPGDEVGTDSTQDAEVNDMLGNPVASGQVYNEAYFAISTPGGTEYIDVIEIGGTVVGYMSTTPLEPGTSYNVLWEADVDSSTALAYSAYHDVPCFAAGTLISTTDGDIPVEFLVEGDRIITRDHGAQPLRWLGRYAHRICTSSGAKKQWPVVIPPDALRPGQPGKPLEVTRQHRVLVAGGSIPLMFGFEEAFAAAGHMWAPTPPHGPKSRIYFHLLFDKHEVIMANGLWCESLYSKELGTSRYLDAPTDAYAHAQTARPCLSRKEAGLVRWTMAEQLAPTQAYRRKRVA